MEVKLRGAPIWPDVPGFVIAILVVFVVFVLLFVRRSIVFFVFEFLIFEQIIFIVRILKMERASDRCGCHRDYQDLRENPIRPSSWLCRGLERDRSSKSVGRSADRPRTDRVPTACLAQGPGAPSGRRSVGSEYGCRRRA